MPLPSASLTNLTGYYAQLDYAARKDATRTENGYQIIGADHTGRLKTFAQHTRENRRSETGARGYFPSVGADGIDRETGWGMLRVSPATAHAAYIRRISSSVHAAPGVQRARSRHAYWQTFDRSYVPWAVSGGSPYADRGTGWHADDCLCRACNA